MRLCRSILAISALYIGAVSVKADNIVIPFSGGPGLGSGTIAPGESYEYNGSGDRVGALRVWVRARSPSPAAWPGSTTSRLRSRDLDQVS